MWMPWISRARRSSPRTWNISRKICGSIKASYNGRNTIGSTAERSEPFVLSARCCISRKSRRCTRFYRIGTRKTNVRYKHCWGTVVINTRRRSRYGIACEISPVSWNANINATVERNFASSTCNRSIECQLHVNPSDPMHRTWKSRTRAMQLP